MRKFLHVIVVGMLLVINLTSAKDKNEIIRSVPVIPGKVIVKFKNDSNKRLVNYPAINSAKMKFNLQNERATFDHAKNLEVKTKLNLQNVFIFDVPVTTDVYNLAEELNKESNVEYAEPAYIHKVDEQPDDALYSQLYHLPQVKAEEAWNIQYGSSDVVIGIIDSGVDWDHEDLVNVIWTNTGEIANNGIDDDNNGYIDDIRGWDFVANVESADPNEDAVTPDNDPMDFNGHGTHVSGIAAGETNNGIGIASVSAGALVMPLRCGYHGADGNGYVPSIYAAEAYIYAADNGADITNQSSGNSGQAILDAAFYAFTNGVLIVESAGNGDAATPSVLGNQRWVMSVASVNQNDQKTYYSSYGDYVTVSAPGGELFANNSTWGILSTIVEPSSLFGNQKYVKFQGTSMAAPLVASVAGLVKSYRPGLTSLELFSIIEGTTDNIDGINPNYAGLLGSGRVNVYRAMTENVTPLPEFSIAGTTITENSGNLNGILDPGENVTLNLKLHNNWAAASNVSVSASFNGDWPLTIADGDVALGYIAGVLDTTNSKVSVPFNISCSADAFPQTLDLQVVVTADGYQETFTMPISISAKILFVADFDQDNGGQYDFTSLFNDDLKQIGVSFDYVHKLNTEITADLLEQYSAVIWGCEWSFPSLDKDDRVALATYLDNGGALFLSGQDIGWELNESETNPDVTFFEDYLKASYVADDANKNNMFGIDDDPITDGIDIDFYQEGRGADEQFPDVITPLDGAVSIFDYDDNSSGAIRYSGNYDLVYFAFGGYEAIDSDSLRQILMGRIVNWFNGISYTLDELTDTENTTDDYVINFSASSVNGNINSAKLFWDSDGNPPYSIIDMTDLGNGNFQAAIPAQSQSATIDYFVYSIADDGNYIISKKISFNVGADIIPPQINLASNPLRNSINVYGPSPYKLDVTIFDNIGIDTASAMLYYWYNDLPPNSVELVSEGNNRFSGTFSFEQPLSNGDIVNYYFAVNDISSNQNLGTSDTLSYMIDSVQVVDDFELNLSDWYQEGEWGLSPLRNSGNFSLSESPDGSYKSNTDKKITYLLPFNLSVYNYALIEYYMRANLERNKDYIYLEISNDSGNNWNKVDSSAISSPSFEHRFVDISEYAGVGNDDIRLRFRFISDDTGVRDGVWIDDISLRASIDSIVSVEKYSDELPIKYSISQNYPNPFNPSTTINFAVPVKSDVNVTVYNVLGEVVRVLADQNLNAGSYSISFDAANTISSGIYFYRISAVGNDGRNFVETKKMMLIK